MGIFKGEGGVGKLLDWSLDESAQNNFHLLGLSPEHPHPEGEAGQQDEPALDDCPHWVLLCFAYQ